MLCETCLGPNPYVRMTKLPFGEKVCKISKAPYQAFMWKAGPHGRFKQTIISFVIAKDRNICQTCLNDMQYGLPVGVRDKLMTEKEGQIALPTSDVGVKYFYEQQQQQGSSELGGGQMVSMSHGMDNIGASNQLAKFSHAQQVVEARSRTAFRNLPKLCR